MLNPRLLHVTDVLPFTGDRNSPAMIEAIRRGKIVHDLCETYDLGQPELPLNHEFMPYLEAWRQFIGRREVHITEIEREVGGHHLGYIGRLDRVAYLGEDKVPWILDIKTGPPWPTHGPQLAAYEQAFRLERRTRKGRAQKLHRACVHLGKDGSWVLKEHKSVHDLATFQAYLRIAYWEISKGLREPPRERS